MAKVLEGVTIETLREAIQQGGIQPGQRFSIIVEDSRQASKSKLVDIAARMKSTAIAKGLTTEVFDAILAQP